MITLLARYVLTRIRQVDPEVSAKLKIELQTFNARTKRWQDEMSEDIKARLSEALDGGFFTMRNALATEAIARIAELEAQVARHAHHIAVRDADITRKDKLIEFYQDEAMRFKSALSSAAVEQMQLEAENASLREQVRALEQQVRYWYVAPFEAATAELRRA